MDTETLETELAEKSEDSAKRRQILDGARSAFLHSGFDGASMNDIVREAGVSKGTLYAYFSSKEDLFEAIIRGELSFQAERLCRFEPDEGGVRPMLFKFGVRLLEKMNDPNKVAMTRIVVAAAGKFPQLGKAFFESGPLFGATRLARELKTLDEAGVLNVPDPERAAWHFLDLCTGSLYKRRLFSVVETLSREDIERGVNAGLDLFMNTYGASSRG
jgi:AcrR family transcriptional regulator